DDAVGRRREHVRDDITGLEQVNQFRQGGHRLSHMDHDRQVERAGGLLGTPQHLVIVAARNVAREASFDAADDVPVFGDGVCRGGDIGAVDIHGVAVWQNARAPDVDQYAAWLRGGFGDCNRFTDAIGSLRSRIYETSHTVRETERRAVLYPGRMGVNVDQTR